MRLDLLGEFAAIGGEEAMPGRWRDDVSAARTSQQVDYRLVRRIKEEASQVIVPYPDPLIIPLGVKYSPTSWGDCE